MHVATGRLVRAVTFALLIGCFGCAVARGAEAPTHALLFSLRGEVRQPGNVPIPPPEGELEDACGVAVDSAGDVYISDYYHHAVDVYGPSHQYLTQIADPSPDGPCNL